ncbi:MAG TPA: hypothetical protein ENN21_10430 [Spirochaetes bacterium]|nr:hypothetical protein [Spirochaetota bacterium]
MAKKERTIITGPAITIRGSIKRHKIVKKVVNVFIETEHYQKGAGIDFRYPVENVGTKGTLYIKRPGKKKNFDFKVDVKEKHDIGSGRHEDICRAVYELKAADERAFKRFWEALHSIYKCAESDVDDALEKTASRTRLKRKYVELLKIIKWMFIMEDILYWDNEGRAFLFNVLLYKSSIAGSGEAESFNQPDRLKRKMKKLKIDWVAAE